MTPLAARLINAASGSHTLTGIAATPIRGAFVNSAPGAYSLIGYDAGLVYYVPAIFINAESGNYALSGLPAGFLSSRMLKTAFMRLQE
jgi:hypothetical protein